MPSYQEKYAAARKQARRFMSERPQGEGLLPLLSEALGDSRPAGEYELGLFEVPLKKVIGTCTDGRRASFAGNFMPLWKSDSEPASKWIHVCQAHVEEGLREPIKAYEYLGYCYVREGHKRVSVLKTVGAYSVLAEVTRILPAWRDDDGDVAVLYEYYRHDRRLPVRHMWFSRPGRLAWLFDEAARIAGGRTQGDELLRDCFARFRRAYHAGDYGVWPMTTGDAFFSYVQVFGWNDRLGAAEMKDDITACATQWRHELALIGLTPPAGKEEHRPPPYILKYRPLTLAFAFEGTPDDDRLTRLHNIARHKLSILRPDVIVNAQEGLPPDDSAWPAFEQLLAKRPHYLFSPSPAHVRLAWRAGLLHPETVVMHMGPIHTPEYRLATCSGRTREPAFLAGSLAGLLTATHRIAVVTPPDVWEMRKTAAFASGAALTNPHARLFWYDGPGVPWRRIQAAFAVHQTDVAWLPARADDRLAGRLFPGVYAYLCALSPAAAPAEVLAAAAWHWHLFYLALTADPQAAIPSETDGPVARLRLGLKEGLIQLHQFDTLLSAGTRRLMRLIRQSLVSGELDMPDAPPDNLSKVEL